MQYKSKKKKQSKTRFLSRFQIPIRPSTDRLRRNFSCFSRYLKIWQKYKVRRKLQFVKLYACHMINQTTIKTTISFAWSTCNVNEFGMLTYYLTLWFDRSAENVIEDWRCTLLSLLSIRFKFLRNKFFQISMSARLALAWMEERALTNQEVMSASAVVGLTEKIAKMVRSTKQTTAG